MKVGIYMKVISHNCPNCKGVLKFEPKSQKWNCKHCKSSLTIEELKKQIESIQAQNRGSDVSGEIEPDKDKLKDVSIDEVKKTVGLINNLISGTPIDEVSNKLEFEVQDILLQIYCEHLPLNQKSQLQFCPFYS